MDLNKIAKKDYTLLDLLQHHIDTISKQDYETFGMKYIVSYLDTSIDHTNTKIAVTGIRGDNRCHTRILFDSDMKLTKQYEYASIGEFLEYLRNSLI